MSFGATDPASDRSVGSTAVARLYGLGLDGETLRRALESGDVAARQATEFHPATAAGTMRWLETVEVLRRLLTTHRGWACDDVRNSPRIIDPTGSRAILVARGNSRTGLDEDAEPQTARPRGDATVRAVQVNGQLSLPLDVAALADESAERTSGVQTWVLLHYRSPDTHELRAELSLPASIKASGHIDRWIERVILPPLTFGPEVGTRDEGDGDVTVDVAAR